MRKAVVWILGLAIMALPAGNAEAFTKNRFNDLSAFTSGEDFRLIFDFEKTPSTKVTFKDDLAQIEVIGAYSVPSKKKFELNRSGIKEIMVYQFDRNTLRIRIFPLEGMEKLRKDLSFTTEGSKLVVNLQKVAGVGEPIPSAVAKKRTVKTGTAAKNLKNRPGKVQSAPKKEKASKSKAATKSRNRSGKSVKSAAAPDKKAVPKAPPKVSPHAADNKNFDLISTANASETVDEKGFLDYSEPQVPAIPSLGEALIKVASSLFIVLAIVLLLAFVAKRYRGTIEAKLGSANEVKVISSQFIGVKKEVTIVEVAGEILVLGVTSQNINLLAKYDDPKMVDQIKTKIRAPRRPKGITKKIPGMKWGISAKSKVSKKFDNQVSDEEAKLQNSSVAFAAENKNRAVSQAAQEIADKLKAMKRERNAAVANATA